jgi:hypothetical protein
VASREVLLSGGRIVLLSEPPRNPAWLKNLRWVIDASAGTIQQGDGEVEMVITGTAEDLTLLLRGEVNPGVLLRAGRIRHLTTRENVSLDEVVTALLSALDVLEYRRCDTGSKLPLTIR